ncbi:MAG: PD40 domain-containing protein [Chlamydiia bacterium]|nr:PD40 domain-containing protein [Chlamydiia bacterium]
MLRLIRLFLFLCSVQALPSEMLEVHLPTRFLAKRVYISRIHTDPSEWDWRYFDDLRAVLEFDLNTGGFSTVAQIRQEWEDSFNWPELRHNFSVDLWKKEGFLYVLTLEVHQKLCTLTAFDIDQKSSKRYPSFPLSGSLAADRREMHLLADTLHRDLFGASGIASRRILYAQRTKNTESEGLGWLSEIWICDSDGANAMQVTKENGYCLSPGFLSSTGDDPEFFYVYNNEGQSKIYKASLSKPEGKPLVALRGSQALPALSKQGNQIAFITDVAGRPDLFVQHLDARKNTLGRPRQIFSSPRATQASPTFSPNGKQMAFVSDKDGSPRIYLLDIPGPKETHRARPRLLTTKNRENTSPAWSPDGKRLAYAAKVDGVRQIWIYDFALGSEMQLTMDSETKENPSWAPDSLHLVYNTESDETSELYLIHLLNPEPQLISKGPGQKRFAAWEP